MPIMDGYLMILLLVTAGSSAWKYIQARRKEPSEVSTLLIDNQSASDSKGKAITLSNQFLPEKTCQMCLFWRQTPVSKPCPPFHLMLMGSKTCCLTLIL